MIPVGSVLVDFDGTACLHDVAEHLLIEFGDPSWPDYDLAWERGEIGARNALEAQAAMLDASDERLLEYALEHCPIDPTFGPFVEWCRANHLPVTIVSDGFGFYIEPLLTAHGIDGVGVLTNNWNGVLGARRLRFDSGHAVCVGCGTCKMQAVTDARAGGPVAFVGEGASDRYGALYADLVFAKQDLPAYCEADGVTYLPWEDFDDVRASLQGPGRLTDPVAPQPCPGWREP